MHSQVLFLVEMAVTEAVASFGCFATLSHLYVRLALPTANRSTWTKAPLLLRSLRSVASQPFRIYMSVSLCLRQTARHGLKLRYCYARFVRLLCNLFAFICPSRSACGKPLDMYFAVSTVLHCVSKNKTVPTKVSTVLMVEMAVVETASENLSPQPSTSVVIKL